MTEQYTVALAGNPNTGKSTLFNTLTGMRQHTGNWAGKTVLTAEGHFNHEGASYKMVDLPGTYSLYSNSADEEAARDYIIFEKPDVTLVVLDATSLERNLNLALQVMEMTHRVVVCINLMDEAKRLGVKIDINAIEKKLGVPTVAISARHRTGIDQMMKKIKGVASGRIVPNPLVVQYNSDIEKKIAELEPIIREKLGTAYPTRWIALRLLDGDESLIHSMKSKWSSPAADSVKGVVSYGHTACH
ncbi:FeoB small GTPase domain-containing protein [Paenibacillus alvei]|uniref:FeoB small GTPase domain-containing protein n=1 Tax=Paenibacillus alvei TaxID=44250 RepID=UPI0018CE83BE|nr:FeoB small GTPase domain-containing protein [Paenibacillus alvei]MBG9735531.1 iron transporter FeoB [Paenibacillus alvei]MBG9746738.1 iron transporter FeoB [Paenibacillus alvei]MCY9578521.1 50S ribosome-binding GTPase [Paenibacillus alvei]MCY9584842.1 50S ribosome-binding GTPase [Paenibacillus alvei]